MENSNIGSSASNERMVIGSAAFTQLVHNHIKKSNIWKERRIYIYGVGYDTKKCKQSLYIDLNTFQLHASTECASQPDSWCDIQTDQLLERCDKYYAFARLLRILIAPRTSPLTPEQAMHEAVISTQTVQGYTTEWRNVRISINSYGKLADRNRCFINFFETKKDRVTRSFVELEPSVYAACMAYYKTGEKMMEPYTEAAEYIANAVRWCVMQSLPSSN